MTGTESMTIGEAVGRLLADEDGVVDLVREAVRMVAQELMEAEVTGQLGAAKHERTDDRSGWRNGHRAREWHTRAGVIDLQIPKLRQGSYFPGFLVPRRRSEQALLAVVQQAYVTGVSTRRVDQFVESLGLQISKSEVSRICGLLDAQVAQWRDRPLEGRWPYLFVDAKVLKVRDGGRVVRKALVVAYGVHEDGHREIVGLDVGACESESFWRTFLAGLVARGLTGVQLAVSDAHEGLKQAIFRVLGATTSWQRCTVHFVREMDGLVTRQHRGMVAAVLRPIFKAADHAEARRLCGDAIAALRPRFGVVADRLEAAEDDLTAFYVFPAAHWTKIRSTNPIERFNREIGRRADVVGIFPDGASVLRLVGMLCAEQNDEWLTTRRYLAAHTMEALWEPAAAAPAPDPEEAPALTAAA